MSEEEELPERRRNAPDRVPESSGSDEREPDDRALAEALRAAFSPSPLSAQRGEHLVQQALEDPLAKANRGELAEAEKLRAALDGGVVEAELPAALRHAAHPAELDPSVAERLLSAALERGRVRRPNVVFVTFGAMAVGLGLAASVALWLLPQSRDAIGASERERLLRSRSLAPLFEEPSSSGKPSERMDRIADVRGRELRENRFAAWGVR